MNIFLNVLKDFAIYFKPNTRAGKIRLGLALAVIVGGLLFVLSGSEEIAPTEEDPKSVRIQRVDSFENVDSLTFVGSVEAMNQATILSETGGRVTRVNVQLGDSVPANTTIATLENASQYASLLQAEGAYEAALAAAGSTNVNVNEAQNTALATFRSSYATVNDVVLNTIDDLFTDPYSHTPGLRIDGLGQSGFLNAERVAFNDLLKNWQTETVSATTNSSLETNLANAKARTERALTVVETFLTILPRQGNGGAYTPAELSAFQESFTTAQQSLNSTIAAIDDAQELLTWSDLNRSGGEISAADAQVKQALGVLRGAQAAYNKTILRTPVAGEVQSLSVRAGDYIAPQTIVATVANEKILEITTHVSDTDRDMIAVGDEVQLEDSVTGIITAIAPSVNPQTGKVEVRIQSENADLETGATVAVTFTRENDTATDENAPIRVPIEALKITPAGPVAFSVNGENRLVEVPVTMGEIEGGNVLITSGLSRETQIVADARGLKENDLVTVQ